MPLSGGSRRRRHHKRRHGGAEGAAPVPVEGAAAALGGAEDSLKEMKGEAVKGGRRMTAKRMVKKIHSLAKQAKKLTLRLKKMKSRKH
jgi:hypothetical protein